MKLTHEEIIQQKHFDRVMEIAHKARVLAEIQIEISILAREISELELQLDAIEAKRKGLSS